MSQASYPPATSHGLVPSGLVSPPKFVLDPIFAWIMLGYYVEHSGLKMSHCYDY